MGRDARFRTGGGTVSPFGRANVPIIGQKAEILDCRGKAITPGDIVLLQTPALQGYLVTKVEPFDGQGADPGALKIELLSRAAFVTMPNAPNMEFLLLEKASLAAIVQAQAAEESAGALVDQGDPDAEAKAAEPGLIVPPEAQ